MTVKNEYTCTCIKCGKQYKIYCTEKHYKNGTYRKTCSSACANSRIMTEEKRQKIKESVRLYVEKNKANKRKNMNPNKPKATVPIRKRLGRGQERNFKKQ